MVHRPGLFVDKTQRYLNSFALGQQLAPKPEEAFHRFLAENLGLRLGGAGSHPSHFTFGWKPIFRLCLNHRGFLASLRTPQSALSKAQQYPLTSWTQPELSPALPSLVIVRFTWLTESLSSWPPWTSPTPRFLPQLQAPGTCLLLQETPGLTLNTTLKGPLLQLNSLLHGWCPSAGS